MVDEVQRQPEELSNRPSNRPRVFLSWSGDKSRAVATALSTWLPNIIQVLDPFMSDGIPAGVQGTAEIFTRLTDAEFGIICVDASNQSAPWLNFEAGALGLRLHSPNRVAPFLLDLKKSDLLAPLTTFQADEADEAGTLHVLKSINTFRTIPLIADDQLHRAFEKFWPELRVELDRIRASTEEPRQTRDPNDILAEILELVRDINRASAGRQTGFQTPRTTGGRIVTLSQGPVGPITFVDTDPVAFRRMDMLERLLPQINQILGFDAVTSAQVGPNDQLTVDLARAPNIDEQAQLRALATGIGQSIYFLFLGGGWQAYVPPEASARKDAAP